MQSPANVRGIFPAMFASRVLTGGTRRLILKGLRDSAQRFQLLCLRRSASSRARGPPMSRPSGASVPPAGVATIFILMREPRRLRARQRLDANAAVTSRCANAAARRGYRERNAELVARVSRRDRWMNSSGSKLPQPDPPPQ